MKWARVASLFMFLAIALGAFGAHGLKGKLTPHSLDIYHTAVFYHVIHALGLFVIAWIATVNLDRKVQMAGILLLAGMILFSGSLYCLAVTNLSWLGMITPLGGILLMSGWLLLAFSVKGEQ